MLHPQMGIQGSPKPMKGSDIIFFWDDMKHDVCTFVAKCDVCLCNKGETVKSPGTLQQLPIPLSIWRDISMDFIFGLPKSGNKSSIMVVVERISKCAHLCALQHPFTTYIFTQIFMDNIFKLHACLLLRQGSHFHQQFLARIVHVIGNPITSQHHLSSQIDGQNEVVNKCLETYLWCFASDKTN
jgi:hypothetical protein